MTDSISSPLDEKRQVNFGPLTTEIQMCNCTPKIDLFEIPYFGSQEALRSEIFAKAIECPNLASPHPTEDGRPLTIFTKGCHNWLKMQRINAYNFGVKGSNRMKLCHATYHKVGIIIYIQHLGGTAHLKFGRAKNVQNSARFRTTFNFDRKYLKNWSIY